MLWSRAGGVCFSNRDDMVLHYSPDVDAIVIDLTPAKRVIDETVALNAPSDAFLDVDASGRGVRIEFLDALTVFACHFYDRSDDATDGRQYAPSLLSHLFFFSFALLSLLCAAHRPHRRCARSSFFSSSSCAIVVVIALIPICSKLVLAVAAVTIVVVGVYLSGDKLSCFACSILGRSNGARDTSRTA